MATNLTKLTIEMPKKEHKMLKALAATLGLSIKDLVLGCIRDHLLYSENKPNAETLKVFEETNKGQNLISFKSKKELYKNLGLD